MEVTRAFVVKLSPKVTEIIALQSIAQRHGVYARNTIQIVVMNNPRSVFSKLLLLHLCLFD